MTTPTNKLRIYKDLYDPYSIRNKRIQHAIAWCNTIGSIIISDHGIDVSIHFNEHDYVVFKLMFGDVVDSIPDFIEETETIWRSTRIRHTK